VAVIPLEKLEPVPVIETAHRLRERIGARFPDRGIHRVAQELATLTEQVADTSAGTRRRSRLVRAGSRGLIAVVVLVALVAFGFAVEAAGTEAPDNGLDWLPLIESAVNDIVFVAVAVVVLHSVPQRVQRSDLLAKLHRLRSLAHIIDMHQLTKEPESLRDAFASGLDGAAEVDLTPEQVEYYLEYCTELLSIVGKAAALCAEESQDDIVLSTVSTIESLTMGMSRKVWQKIFVLNDERTAPTP
jgi:type VI protein secretion system component VasF